jgi:hypothetical protein
VQVRIADPASAEALIHYLRACDCVVDALGEAVLEVNPLGSIRHELAASDLADLLQAWLVDHPGSAIALDARSAAHAS